MNPSNSAGAPSRPGSSARAGTTGPPRRPPLAPPSYESLRSMSNIRIRRLSSAVVPQSSHTAQDGLPTLSRQTTVAAAPPAAQATQPDEEIAGRRRSFSAPQRFQGNVAFASTDDASRPAPPITGQPSAAHRAATMPSVSEDATPKPPSSAGHGSQRNRGLSIRRRRSVTSQSTQDDAYSHYEYDSDVIDLLDLVDPEVRTISTLTNLQNSLFVPDLGGLINRRPTYDLTRHSTLGSAGAQHTSDTKVRPRAATYASRMGSPLPTIRQERERSENAGDEDGIELQESGRLSISSELSDSRYAVLPHGVSLEGWTDEEIADLNDHVRHLLHSRREGFKRGWRGFKKYVSRPLGLFIVVYATLVTLFGAAWVFCLIGWIYVGSRQDYFINVIDNVLVALFALIGDGLAPFRAVDTYHMCFIAHYHHLTWRLRQERKLPNLVDENDLPERHMTPAQIEDLVDKEETAEFSVLSHRQQKRLQYHQAKFNKSHTFYKPHETATHHAFPLRLLVAVVVLLDCHSLFQVALGTCTWSIDYHVRPEALTATILSCSITCNIMAGVLISIGDHKTRKKDVLERMFRQDLTEQALRTIAKKHNKDTIDLPAADPATSSANANEVDAKDALHEVFAPTTTSSVGPSADSTQPRIGDDKL